MTDTKTPAESIAARHTARAAVRRANEDLRTMHRIADEWDKLTDAGKKFMLSALSSGMKEADRADSA